MREWFQIEQIDEDTYCISEYRHWEETHCYVVNGKTHTLLIDTGLGIQNIYDEVMKVSKNPLICIATHIHWDHIGSHASFPNFYVHEKELDWVQGQFPLPLAMVKKSVVDRCDLPDRYDVSTYSIFQGTPTHVIVDDEYIDLGKRKIKVLHTPGHSPGHMCFWEEERGYLFSGDLIYNGMLYANYPSTSPSDYASSIAKVAKLPIKKLLPGHHDLVVPVDIVKRMNIAFKELAKENKLVHGAGKFYYDDWSLWL